MAVRSTLVKDEAISVKTVLKTLIEVEGCSSQVFSLSFIILQGIRRVSCRPSEYTT